MPRTTHAYIDNRNLEGSCAVPMSQGRLCGKLVRDPVHVVTEYTGETVSIAPDPRVYSPHIRLLKTFVERLSEHMRMPNNEDEHRRMARYVEEQLPAVRAAMSEVLSDDFVKRVIGPRS